MEFVLNRDKILSSTLGHTIEFKKGVKTHVPKELWAAAQGIGAIPAEELPEETKPESKEPLDPIERKAVIFKTFESLVLGAKREDFTGNGAPHAKALLREMGFSIDNKERDILWQEFKLGNKDE